MKIEESRYVKILLWAYENQSAGFTEKELFTAFNLDNDEGRKWYLKVFREHTLLIDHIMYTDKSTLTAEGMSAAVNYLNLKEAQESGRRAQLTANWAIGISVVVGIVQIVLALIQICLNLS